MLLEAFVFAYGLLCAAKPLRFCLNALGILKKYFFFEKLLSDCPKCMGENFRLSNLGCRLTYQKDSRFHSSLQNLEKKIYKTDHGSVDDLVLISKKLDKYIVGTR